MAASFKDNFNAMSLNKKIVLFASLLTVISTLMPWYSDIDRFNIGDTFLGITGPLYLAGLIVFFANLSSFIIVMLPLFDRPSPKLPVSERRYYVVSAVLSVLMLVLSASVYFHPKFGINLVDKNMGIGMIIAFIGTGGLLLGGILKTKARTQKAVLEEDSVEEMMQSVYDGGERAAGGVDREMTVEEATKAWGQVEESVDVMTAHNAGLPGELHKKNTNDIQ